MQNSNNNTQVKNNKDSVKKTATFKKPNKEGGFKKPNKEGGFKKPNNSNHVKTINNGEGVKAAFEKAILGLFEKLDKLWETEGGKKYITHLMYSFLPMNKKEVFPIGNFKEHPKYDNTPKLCTLTGFALSDSSFVMDDVTKKHFEEKGKKVNKLVYAIPCAGSSESNKIISASAMIALNDWTRINLEKEASSNSKEFTTIMASVLRKMNGIVKSDVDKTKVVRFDKPKKLTYTLADTFDFTKLKSFNDKEGGSNE